jgi:hypothetical protein
MRPFSCTAPSLVSNLDPVPVESTSALIVHAARPLDAGLVPLEPNARVSRRQASCLDEVLTQRHAVRLISPEMDVVLVIVEMSGHRGDRLRR